MRSKLIIGNWKMHFKSKPAVSFAAKLAQKTVPEGVTVVVAPPALLLSEVAAKLAKTNLKLAAQNAYFRDEGAFTGEISMPMLRGLAQYVIIGHSERRQIFHETNADVQQKVAAATRSNLTPILCIGESLLERQHGYTQQVLSEQLLTGLANLTAEEVARLIIAYEPVWAIGTGQYARPEEVEAVASRVRAEIGSLYGAAVADTVHLLYGGSVSTDNAAAYLSLADIDGLLVGGASLNLAAFWSIVNKAAETLPKKIKVKK